ncbi:DASH complex subunit Dad1-domain-containing protein [Apiospora hydei]|uniref:DASH complex subunit DAD1 n=1 Tax=Apiospora hydei TaxID=1337664 RepID=A0ABR1XE87_9PEZI
MSTNQRPASAFGMARGEKSFFEQQRELLIGEIAMVRLLFFRCANPIASLSLSPVCRRETNPRLNPPNKQNFEHVLANINKLNRSLEAVIAVGHEFSSVEALWSQFEGVMAKEPEQPATAANNGDETMGDQTKQEDEDDDITARVKEEDKE